MLKNEWYVCRMKMIKSKSNRNQLAIYNKIVPNKLVCFTGSENNTFAQKVNY